MKTIILAGGKSSRMGKNKALLPIEGKSIIKRIAEEFTPISEEIIIIANIPEIYNELDLSIFPDVPEFRGEGPLAGIYTGIDVADEDFCLFIACDMPFVSRKIGEYLIRELKNSGVDAVIPSHQGRVHPLFGAYHKRIQPFIKENLLNGKRKMSHLLNEVNAKIIEKQDIPEELQVEWEYCLWNLNTLEDYQKALEFYQNINKLYR
ncbi:molybdenum cofactor guanylyltransferase [Bacillus sp. SAJ1]|nr:molybdenum cofactor guanylyltransferase [Bacillus sp. SAJ1]